MVHLLLCSKDWAPSKCSSISFTLFRHHSRTSYMGKALAHHSKGTAAERSTIHQHWEPPRENYFGVRSLNMINCSYRISDSYAQMENRCYWNQFRGERREGTLVTLQPSEQKQANKPQKVTHTHSLLVCSPRLPSSRQCCTTSANQCLKCHSSAKVLNKRVLNS